MVTKHTKNDEVQMFIGKRVPVAVPKVSIITPAYNIAPFVAETLDSVRAQTYRNFEILLINDGSPDTEQFEKAITPYLDELIYLKQDHTGAGAARNIAIQKARGELLAFLDGDDMWLPEFLESQVRFLEEHPYDMVYCDALMFGMPGSEGRRFMESAGSSGKVTIDSILTFDCNVITSGTVARRQAVVDAGMFEWENVRAHDFHLWLRMLQNGTRIGYQKKALLKYRVHLDSLSGNSIQRVQREIDVLNRIGLTIRLTHAQKRIVKKQMTGLEADLEIEYGKSLLLEEDFTGAQVAFERANEIRRSTRLRLIIGLTSLAPRLLLKLYRSRRADEIAFVPDKKSSERLR